MFTVRRLSVFIVLCAGCRAELVESPLSADQLPTVNHWKYESTTVLHPRFACAAEELVPQHPVPLAGFGGIHRRLIPPSMGNIGSGAVFQAPYESIDTVIPRVKVCLVASDANLGRIQTALLSLDVVATTPDLTKTLVSAVRNTAHMSANAPVMISASHTHSGPAGLWRDPLFATFAGDIFLPDLVSLVVESVRKATEQARLNLSSSQPLHLTASIHDKLANSRIAGLGVDTRISVGVANGTSPAACFFVAAAHPTMVGQDKLILSADLAGALERSMEEKYGATTCLFLPGPLGNADASLQNSETREEFSARIATETQEPERLVHEEEVLSLRVSLVPFSLPKPAINASACNVGVAAKTLSAPLLANRSRTSVVGIWRTGTSVIAFVPGEPTWPVAQAIQTAVQIAAPDIEHVQIVATANDYLGYFVEMPTYGEKSLESCSTLYGPTMGTILGAAIVKGL